jgi:hypothetical protein
VLPVKEHPLLDGTSVKGFKDLFVFDLQKCLPNLFFQSGVKETVSKPDFGLAIFQKMY